MSVSALLQFFEPWVRAMKWNFEEGQSSRYNVLLSFQPNRLDTPASGEVMVWWQSLPGCLRLRAIIYTESPTSYGVLKRVSHFSSIVFPSAHGFWGRRGRWLSFLLHFSDCDLCLSLSRELTSICLSNKIYCSLYFIIAILLMLW